MRRRPLSFATWCLLVLAVSLYVASFFLPAYREPQSGSGTGPQIYRVDRGYDTFVPALIFGWPAWWANPAFWLAAALLIARRNRAALPLAVVALALALTAIPLATVFQFKELYRLMAGYWVWTAASAILVLVCFKDRIDGATRPKEVGTRNAAPDQIQGTNAPNGCGSSAYPGGKS